MKLFQDLIFFTLSWYLDLSNTSTCPFVSISVFLASIHWSSEKGSSTRRLESAIQGGLDGISEGLGLPEGSSGNGLSDNYREYKPHLFFMSDKKNTETSWIKDIVQIFLVHTLSAAD
jgi:hypothetical protein